MPPAVALAVPAIAGAAGSAAGGKKSGNAAKKAADQQFQMQQQLFSTGMQAWQPAQQYWSSLLSGDPNKVSQAVGPYADIIRGQGQASANQLAATTPAGGEANLAQQQNQMGTYNQIARLSAGMQPQAAAALDQLSRVPMLTSEPNVGSGLTYNMHQQEQASQAKGGLGQGLGQIIGRRGQSKGEGNAGGGSSGKTGSSGGGGKF